MENLKKVVVLSGAGISAESGIQTFRGADGLWEGHEVMKVASPEGWEADQKMVLDFYNARRRQLKEVQPNAAHKALVKLEQFFTVDIITQNVDDLHERAGNQNILHIHGELLKSRSTGDPNLVYDCPGDLNMGDNAEDGHQLRPHIVWFGEEVPLLQSAAEKTYDSDIVIIVGTSMQVYPAASLIRYAREHVQIYYIDPNPALNYDLEHAPNVKIFADKAAERMPKLVNHLIKNRG